MMGELRAPLGRPALALILTWACAGHPILAPGQTASALPGERKAGRSHADATSLTAQTDRLFARWDKPGSPGGALAVVQDGKVVYQRGYGMANLEYDIPITPATIFDVASVSKQFTAFAVQLLAQEHRLSLDDDVRKYLPELHDFGQPITIRHLLHHTSGLRDQWNLLWLAGWRNQDVITEQDVLNLVWRQEELNFEPGAEHLYSNTGYTLLGLIVKRISGRSLDAFCQERMFKPLGMQATHFHDDNRTIVPGRSYSYSPKPGGGFANNPLQYATVGASSLFTTVQDLARWDRNFRDARVGGPEVVARMLEKGKLNNGEELAYACGLELGEYRSLKTVKHNGHSAGYRSSIVRFPEQRFTVIILSNLSSSDPEAMARKVADLYLTDKLAPRAPAARRKPDSRTEVKVDPKVYDAYAGDYQTSEGRVVTFSTVNGRLMLHEGRREKIRLLPSSETDYFLRDLSVELSFVKEKDGLVDRVFLRRDGREQAARRVRREPLTPARLAGYAGDYYSRELGVIYSVATREGKLWIRHPRGEASTEEIGNDAFSVDFPIGTIKFTRNPHHDINAMLVSTNGPVRNLRFARAQIKTKP
jgi:CubicO group peptidase (beta-lactamase class C family)